MRWLSGSIIHILVIKCLVVVALLFSGKASGPGAHHRVIDSDRNVNNIIGDGADPWVIKDGGFYYVCLQRGGGFVVSKSAKLSQPLNYKQVWHQPVNGWNKNCLWAPELHHIGDKWYIYYAAGESGPPFIHQRAGVLESVTNDPQGEYIDKGMLKTGDDPNNSTKTIWAIDLTVTTINGQLYAVWSGWDQNQLTDHTPQSLFMAQMSNPWTISSERVKISAPEQPWETGGPLNINEGPEFLKHDGHVFIIYSTRESWLSSYRLGQLALADSTRNILSPNNWIKSGPVFTGTPDVFGVGHASFTTSPDGKEWWIMYHSKKQEKPGWERDIRLQKFKWHRDGSPNFGKPLAGGTFIKKPSGEQ